jgi:hypothetical protein
MLHVSQPSEKLATCHSLSLARRSSEQDTVMEQGLGRHWQICQRCWSSLAEMSLKEAECPPLPEQNTLARNLEALSGFG